MSLRFPQGASQVAQVKNPPANAGATGDASSIPGLGRSPEGRDGNPIQYSCWDNTMDRGAWQATVHGVTKSQTWLKVNWAHMRAWDCLRIHTSGCVTKREFPCEDSNTADEPAWSMPCLTQFGHCLISLCFLGCSSIKHGSVGTHRCYSTKRKAVEPTSVTWII